MVGPTSSTISEVLAGVAFRLIPLAFDDAFAVTLNRVAPAKSRQAAAKIFGFVNAFVMLVSSILIGSTYIRLALSDTEGASSSHGFGGMVGPTSSTGSEIVEGAFLSPRPSGLVVDEALIFALKIVATANRIVAVAKSFVFANALDMGYSPG
jgi:hypothetical protein